MNLQEAHSILELSLGVSAEDAKKKYREFARKYHPDVNKDPGSEDRFKKINEAYQCILTGKSTDREEVTSQTSYNPFGKQTIIQVEHISLHTSISFQESVLGCKKDFKFQRRGKCVNCQGQGEIQLNNNCIKCQGRGQIVERQNNMIFARTCDQCLGKKPVIPCTVCQTNGFLETEVSVSVTIPGGILNNNTLRLSGMGHYVGSFLNMDQFSDAHLKVIVVPEEGLHLINNDVVSKLDLSLLEALTGCTKTIKTIVGEQEVIINPSSKNKEEIIIPNLGVNKIGNHRVIMNVYYPDNIDKIIEILSNSKEI